MSVRSRMSPQRETDESRSLGIGICCRSVDGKRRRAPAPTGGAEQPVNDSANWPYVDHDHCQRHTPLTNHREERADLAQTCSYSFPKMPGQAGLTYDGIPLRRDHAPPWR